MLKFFTVVIFCLLSSLNILGEDVKQPVFLICPHQDDANSISLYVLCDKDHPEVLKGVGIEEISGKNTKNSGPKLMAAYSEVLKAQKNSNVKKNQISELLANEFETGSLPAGENGKINIILKDGVYNIHIKSKINVDNSFEVGGNSKDKRDVVLTYSRVYKEWKLEAKTFVDEIGKNFVGQYPKTITGLIFNAGTTTVFNMILIDEFLIPHVIYKKDN